MQKYAYRGHAFKKSRGRPLIRAIHNKSLFDSENFSSFAKFAFQNKRSLLKNGASSFFVKICSVFCSDIIWRRDCISEKSISFLIDLKEWSWGIVVSELIAKYFSRILSMSRGNSGGNCLRGRSSSPERCLWMIFGKIKMLQNDLDEWLREYNESHPQ